MMAQSGHAIAEFSSTFNVLFNEWHLESNYLIILETQDENHLKRLYEKLKWRGADVVAFHEPDINDQLTSICYYGTPELRKITNKYKLALWKTNG